MTVTRNTAWQTCYKTSGETRAAAVDLSGKLGDGETLSGTPTITATPSGLTITSPLVTTDEMEIADVEVAIGQALTFVVAGGTDGVSYTIKVSCGTSGGQTLQEFLSLLVQDS